MLVFFAIVALCVWIALCYGFSRLVLAVARTSSSIKPFIVRWRKFLLSVLTLLLVFAPIFPSFVTELKSQIFFRYFCFTEAGFIKLTPVKVEGLYANDGEALRLLSYGWVHFVEVDIKRNDPALKKIASFDSNMVSSSGRYKFSILEDGDDRCALFENLFGSEWLTKIEGQPLPDQDVVKFYMNLPANRCLGIGPGTPPISASGKPPALYALTNNPFYNLYNAYPVLKGIRTNEVSVVDVHAQEKISTFRNAKLSYHGIRMALREIIRKYSHWEMSRSFDTLQCSPEPYFNRHPKYDYPGSAIHAKFFGLE